MRHARSSCAALCRDDGSRVARVGSQRQCRTSRLFASRLFRCAPRQTHSTCYSCMLYGLFDRTAVAHSVKGPSLDRT